MAVDVTRVAFTVGRSVAIERLGSTRRNENTPRSWICPRYGGKAGATPSRVKGGLAGNGRAMRAMTLDESSGAQERTVSAPPPTDTCGHGGAVIRHGP